MIICDGFKPSVIKMREKKKSATGNATNKVNRRILEAIKNSKKVLTITELSKKTGTQYYATKDSVKFLEQLGIINLVSNGHVVLVSFREAVPC